MTDVPISPRLVKGAIVGVDLFNPLASVIMFHYNPETLTRTLQADVAAIQEGGRSEPMRFRGAPSETVKLDVEIDAADQLERQDPVAADMGIHPQLAALEMLLYPKSSVVIANTVLLAAGVIETIQPLAPLTLFIWGPRRVLPVRITSLSITEEAYSEKLNPIRAKVSLELRVLSYSDLPLSHPGYALFVAHQVAKEAMAVLGSGESLSAVLSGKASVV